MSLRSHVHCFILLLVSFNVITAQSFEGTITYHLAPQNPNPEMLSDEEFKSSLKEVFGEEGVMVMSYSYKGGSYVSKISAGKEHGYQLYNKEDSLLYSWQEGSTEAQTLDSRKYMDEFVEIIETDDTEEIIGHLCKKITIKSKFGETHVWYPEGVLSVDPSLYEGHLYGHWVQTIQKTATLPLKTEVKGLMGHFIQTAVEFQETDVSDELFVLPKFDTVTPNPMN